MDLNVHFTSRERDVLQKLSVGSTTQEVMKDFHFTERELTEFLGEIYSKLEIRKVVGAREEAVCYAVLGGFIPGPNVRRLSLDVLTEPEKEAAMLLPLHFQDRAIANRMSKNNRESAAMLLSEARTKLGAKTRTHLAAIMVKLTMM